MKERHWDSLVTGVRHGQCVLVLGPEIPAILAAEDPDNPTAQTTSYTEALAQYLSRELQNDGQVVHGLTLAAVAQQYEDEDGFGSNALRAQAGKFSRSAAYKPSKAHALLASLPFGLILTTSHDDLLEKSLRDAGKSPVIQAYNFRGDQQENRGLVIPDRPDAPVLYYLFGNPTSPTSLVLSENDLLDFLIAVASERPQLPNSLLRALKRMGQSYLFVGFGIRHWHLRVLLKILIRALDLHPAGGRIASEPLRDLADLDRQQTMLFYQRGRERGTRIEVEDDDVVTFLTEFNRRVEAEGGFAGVSTPIGLRPRVFISHAREDAGLALEIFDQLKKSHCDPWIDRSGLDPGVEFDQTIRSELAITDFVIILCTSTLGRKTDSYVNREIELSLDRALSVRGSFIFPLLGPDFRPEHGIAKLAHLHSTAIRLDTLEQDLTGVISAIRRDFQRRSR